ncbi:hypothetical protein GCM10010302_02670 [Streptomyces polychromogenes]|uniref:EamA domain-containing protein n=1 Tax=Streptomyces polychromogenes TaxID=67342 RepID=A0ABP3EL97_9ACTN
MTGATTLPVRTAASRLLRPSVLGPLLVLTYCLVNAGKSVLEGALLQRMTPEFLAFNAFLLAQVWSLCTVRDRRALVRAVRRSLRDVLLYNVATACSWLAVLYALTYLEPAVANSLIVGIVPAGTILIGMWLRPESRTLFREKAAACGVLGAMAWLSWLAWCAREDSEVTTGGFAIGLAACVVTAASVAASTHFTKRLSKAGFTVGQMMASRFGLLLTACMAVLWLRGDLALYQDHALLPAALGCGAVTLAALWLLQQGIVRTEPVTVSFLLAANLLVTYAAQLLDPRLRPTLPTLLAIVLLTAFVVIGVLARRRPAQ